jgi:hypothetical protein
MIPEDVSIDWADKVSINSICQQRMLEMMAVADDRHFTYANETSDLENKNSINRILFLDTYVILSMKKLQIQKNN